MSTRQISRTQVVSPELIKKFGDLSGDINPIHFDDQAAIQSGFRERIAHGNILCLMVTAIVGLDFNFANPVILSQSINFHHPIYPGDTITALAEVTHNTNALGLVEVEIRFNNGEGMFVAAGRCILRCRTKA